MQNYNKEISHFSLMDDVFFKEVTKNNLKFTLYLIKPILNFLEFSLSDPIPAETQARNCFLKSHDMIMDLLIILENGMYIDIEIENRRKDHLKRLRYYITASDVSELRKGLEYGELSDRIFVSFSDRDFPDNKETFSMYQFKHRLTNKIMDIGLFFVFINMKIKDGNYPEIEKLVSEITEKNIDKLSSGIVKDTHHELKMTEEGRKRLNAEL